MKVIPRITPDEREAAQVGPPEPEDGAALLAQRVGATMTSGQAYTISLTFQDTGQTTPVATDGNTGGNFNRYVYANNSPYQYMDPDGRQERAAEAFNDQFRRDSASGNSAVYETLQPLAVIVTIDGGVVAQGVSPGKVPGSSALYEKQIDSAGKTIQYTKTTTAPDGAIVHVKDKITGNVVTP